MQTPETTTPENPKDTFTLTFLHWLNNNYNFLRDYGYYSRLDNVSTFEDTDFLTPDQCVTLFRRQDILSLTELPTPSTSRALDLAEEALQQSAIAARNNVVLMGGYKKITALLERTVRSPLLDSIREIYLETMTQLNQK